ncbi:MAG: redoxin domain-containing protein, partial [Acidobacteriaceae bacterium]|nr:redoxin domain-containing protein [Acidobacteriaceae bacterium]
MKAFQSGMQKFQDSGAKVFAISTDNGPSQKAFAQSLGL